MLNVYEATQKNKLKSSLIVAGFICFVSVAIYVLLEAFNYYLGYEAGPLGLFGLALVISGFMAYLAYYFSDQIVLSISSARPADRKKDFLFYTVVENLAIGTGLPKPRLFVIDDSAPNAFAAGRDPEHAVICVTRGLLDKLSRTELEGVIAHEFSHIRNYDARLATLVAVMVGIVALLGDWFLRSAWGGTSRSNEKDRGERLIVIFGLVFAILSPLIARLIQLAISRRREFLADIGSVEMTRQPQALISALEKISKDMNPLESANKATAHLYIVNPFKEKGHGVVNWFSGLFNTHPPITERIKVLKQMM